MPRLRSDASCAGKEVKIAPDGTSEVTPCGIVMFTALPQSEVMCKTREAHITCEANITSAGLITFRQEHIVEKGLSRNKVHIQENKH